MIDVLHLLTGRAKKSDDHFTLNTALALVAGALLSIGPNFVFVALMWIVSGMAILDGVFRIVVAIRGIGVKHRFWTFFNGLVFITCGYALWLLRSSFGFEIASAAVGVYCFALGWSMLFSPDEGPEEVEMARSLNQHPDEALCPPAHPEFGRVRAEAITEEVTRRPIDLYWVLTLVATFLAIHVGRMRPQMTWLGLLGPLVATLGDILAAVLLSVMVILPLRLIWRKVTRPLERRLWGRFIEKDEEPDEVSPGEGLVRWWLDMRVRFSVRMRLARCSFRSGLRDILEQGLPVMAVLVAVNPIWGFSWYFNSENRASGVWQELTEGRVDLWREGMLEAVQAKYRDKFPDLARLFEVTPPGTNTEDFSFVVIGDTGEGDPSQLVLHDQLIDVARHPEVKFFVVSSDVMRNARLRV